MGKKLIPEEDSFHSPVGKHKGKDTGKLISDKLVRKFDAVLGGNGSTMRTERFLEAV